ncbi:transcriptional regulator, XRE family (peptidase S24 LexA-like domain) [Campylobacter iguaniorum]|uniref:XRE family transcriptional regulator n=1 Tax=Campylobacter iguaniorum TaxID=1244531 RepID=UPI0007C95273|nr:LexA family transcriptional regulator [Campylobacter iguaniorum]ANE35697.1 transcriptional regulator, XRE family (peptidase S24 LexA-like domain) [Campylobacter iguaniorum]
MDLGKKIRIAREEQGLSQAELANMLNITSRTLQNYEYGTSVPDIKIVQEMAKIFKVKISYFLDDNFDVSIDVSPVVSNQISVVSPSNLKKSQLEQIKNDQIYIRQLSSSVGAGESVDIDGIEIYDTDILVPFSQMLFKVRPKNTDRVRCMKVDGYSMVPMLFPDSWVIADVTATFAGDGLYIINYCGNFMVKLLQKSPNGVLHIKSINKDYESYDIEPDDDVNVYIVGKVLRCVI